VQVHLSRVTFAWPDDDPILSDVELTLHPGWTAVVGANGAGKTTLLRLIAGELSPTSGGVRAPSPVHLCRQRVELDAAVEEFSWDWSPEACRWRGRLGLDPDDVARWSTLSPGERKRWQIGAALAAEPPVLLLDEPTNHLDADGRQRLAEALRAWRGVGVVVSHDRAFLDALATSTVLVDGGARALPLRPSDALAQVELEAKEALDALSAAQERARAARRAVAEARRVHASAVRSRSVRSRSKGNHDHEARSMGAKFVAETAERSLSKDLAAARTVAARAEQAVEGMERPESLGRSLFVRHQPAPRSPVLALPLTDVRAGDAVVLRDVEVALERGAHVHLAGPNGAGKTTLLNALVSASHLPEDRLLFVPQEHTPEQERAWLERLRSLPLDERGQVLQIVAALGVDPGALLATDQPSPGEARKLAIAYGLGRDVWAVVLDEPTNHLDLPSIQRLEAALAAWPGALLLVTHDQRFAASCCTDRWRIADGRVEIEAVVADPEGAQRP